MRLKLLIFNFIVIFISGDVSAEEIFTNKKLYIKKANGAKYEFNIEIADTNAKHAQGLQDKKSMPKDHGMLFLFTKPVKINMWMKGTYISLDMLFIKPDGKIGKIVANTVPFSLDSIPSGGLIKEVLELNAGMCKKLSISENDEVIF
jgi:uncharacterized membrane protein (UPF0127 family)